ncbi:hypothetical protein FACS1894167_15880 [Synergistales bacterium]|nr:hypothetical protein FACS1894167_15880 [Synergistales bacterium]GHV52502.1 hypothetical protein FACS1894216_08740 [Synergistales bacterium]
MSYRIAVGTSDGENVTEHFGQCAKWTIMEAGDDGVWRFLESRAAPPSSGGAHDDEALRKFVEILGDCRAVLVSKIGPGAERMLSRASITAFERSGAIDGALRKLAEYYARTERATASGRG